MPPFWESWDICSWAESGACVPDYRLFLLLLSVLTKLTMLVSRGCWSLIGHYSLSWLALNVCNMLYWSTVSTLSYWTTSSATIFTSFSFTASWALLLFAVSKLIFGTLILRPSSLRTRGSAESSLSFYDTWWSLWILCCDCFIAAWTSTLVTLFLSSAFFKPSEDSEGAFEFLSLGSSSIPRKSMKVIVYIRL